MLRPPAELLSNAMLAYVTAAALGVAAHADAADTLFGQPVRSPPLAVAVQFAQPLRTNLLAHDINGFQLGMTVRQVAALAPNGLERWGDDLRATVGGVKYDFGFTALGHLYRIDSTQNLGQFVPDRAFGLALTRRLSIKFGVPQGNQLPGGPAVWGYSEPYISVYGTRLNRTTESLSAMLEGGFGQPMTLIMKLMDFRILRQDATAVNATPAYDAGRAITF